jgi:hypothetical protein
MSTLCTPVGSAYNADSIVWYTILRGQYQRQNAEFAVDPAELLVCSIESLLPKICINFTRLLKKKQYCRNITNIFFWFAREPDQIIYSAL